jgi:hypothetical protein
VSKREFKRKISTFQCCWPNERNRKREGEFLHRETENEEEKMLCVNQRGSTFFYNELDGLDQFGEM